MRMRWAGSLVLAGLGCAPNTGGLGGGEGGHPVGEGSSGGPDDTATGSVTSVATTAMSMGGADDGGDTTSAASGVGTTSTIDDGTSSTSSTSSTSGEPGGSSEGGSSGDVPTSDLPELECADEGLLFSIADIVPAQITFHNESGAVRRIYWLDYMGDRVDYGVIVDGDAHVQGTYATHPWVVTDASEVCVGIYVADVGDHDVWLY